MPVNSKRSKKVNNSNNLPEVEVTAAAPSWLKYEHQFLKTFPKSERIQQYLTPMARSLGNSASAYPERIDKQYEADKNDFVARMIMLDRNNDKFTDKEKQIIGDSRYAGKTAEYAYKNPIKLPVTSDDPYLNYLYQNDFLAKVPGVRSIIQHMAGKKINNRTIENGYYSDDKKSDGQQNIDDPMNYNENKVNMLSEYLHGDQGLKKSNYKPKQDYFPFLPTYSLKQKLGVSENFAENMKQYIGDIENIKKNPLYLNGLGTAPYASQPDLGHYKSGVAWDDTRNLPYYFVSDAWDFDPQDYSARYGKDPQQAYQQAYLMHQIGNPYKIYDRFYFNPETGSYIEDEQKSSRKMKNGGILPSKGKALPKATLGYDLQSIDTGFRGDPAALQNPIPSSPYKPILPGADPAGGKSINFPRINFNLAPAMMGLAAIVNNNADRVNRIDEQSRQARMRAMIPSDNANRYGNGSQMLFQNGGKIKSKGKEFTDGLSPATIMPLSANSFSEPVMEFIGPSHENGGIPISYQGSQVEVEGDETAYIDYAGDLNVFGNLTVPGSRMKFKTAMKKLADKEKMAVTGQKKAEKILQLSDTDDPIGKLKFNTAKVQLSVALSQQKAISREKENISELQRQVLGSIHSGRAENGIKLPGSNTGIDPWGLPETPQIVIDQAKKINENYPIFKTAIQSPVVTPSLAANSRQVSEPGFNNNDIEIKDVTTPVYDRPLAFGQILPEAFAMATNKVDSVPVYNFNPQLLSNFKVDFGDKLQENNNTFRALVKQAGNNPAILSQLAAAKYQADTSVLGDQYRTNLTTYFQRENQNTELINQARLQNLAMAERADIARAQNEAASRSVTREAIRSIAGKVLQQKQANHELTLINQLTPYHRIDQQTGKWEFAGGPAPIIINGMPVYQQQSPSLYNDKEQTTYARDSKGRLTERMKTKIPSLNKIFRR